MDFMKTLVADAVAKRKWLQCVLGILGLVAMFELFKFGMGAAGIKFPPALVAMIAFFLLLASGVIPARFVEAACKFALAHMAICFVPILVMIVGNRSMLEGRLLPLFSSVAISSALTLLATGAVVEVMQRRRQKKLKKKEDA